MMSNELMARSVGLPCATYIALSTPFSPTKGTRSFRHKSNMYKHSWKPGLSELNVTSIPRKKKKEKRLDSEQAKVRPFSFSNRARKTRTL